MKTSSILDTYQTWLTHREYSPATIQKYTKALARFLPIPGQGTGNPRRSRSDSHDIQQLSARSQSTDH